MAYLVDTDVLIDCMRGNPDAVFCLQSLAGDYALSRITALELVVGSRDNRNLAEIDRFLETQTILPLVAEIGARAYSLVKTYARSHGLQPFDALIAATAIEENLTLVSKNRKHFAMIANLSLQVPRY